MSLSIKYLETVKETTNLYTYNNYIFSLCKNDSEIAYINIKGFRIDKKGYKFDCIDLDNPIEFFEDAEGIEADEYKTVINEIIKLDNIISDLEYKNTSYTID